MLSDLNSASFLLDDSDLYPLQHHKTIFPSRAFYRVLWAIFVNYWTWDNNRSFQIEHRRAHSLRGPTLVANVWSEERVMKDCDLSLWSVAKTRYLGLQVIAWCYAENPTCISTWLKDIYRIQRWVSHGLSRHTFLRTYLNLNCNNRTFQNNQDTQQQCVVHSTGYWGPGLKLRFRVL